jgi:hemolysin activation/secretion protein
MDGYYLQHLKLKIILQMEIVMEAHGKFLILSLPISIFFFLILLPPADAQESLGVDPTLRSGDRRERYPEEKPETKPKPIIKSPPVPDNKKSPDAELPAGPNIRIEVTQIRTIGNKTFSDAELAAVTKPFLNKRLDYEDLEQIRRKLTLHYIQNGYINSGAVLPNQEITKGVVTFVIVEGRLTKVDISGNRWLRDWYYKSRINLDAGPPVNINALQQRLQMLQQHDLVKKLQAELKPGVEPGKSTLALEVEEHSPFKMRLSIDNYQSPSVGSERGVLTLENESLTGIGDLLHIAYGRSEGLDPLLDLSYQVPFTPLDTELKLGYRKNDFGVIDEPFKTLDIESESEIFEVNLRQPFYRTLNQEFAMGLTGERLHNRASLLGQSFSFSPGSVDGESTVSALRVSAEYIFRSRRQVISGHSRFSFGIDTLDATIHHNNDPDGEFFAWLGQFQYAGIITPLQIQTILRADIQLTNDPLLSLEQLPIGGRYSVRGYRENQLVRDNGVIASLETRVPLVQNAVFADYLQLVPFFDYGQGWNAKSETPAPNTIYSVGMGLRWALEIVKKPFPLKTEIEFYWGYPLETVDTDKDNLQDEGIHFQFVISAF